MNTIEVKTAELSGQALDDAVAVAIGWIRYPDDSVEHGDTWHLDSHTAPFGRVMPRSAWHPSTDWSQCGPLIEKYRVGLDVRPCTGRWDAYCDRWVNFNESPLVAACRAIVAAKLGGMVQVPAELVGA